MMAYGWIADWAIRALPSPRPAFRRLVPVLMCRGPDSTRPRWLSPVRSVSKYDRYRDDEGDHQSDAQHEESNGTESAPPTVLGLLLTRSTSSLL